MALKELAILLLAKNQASGPIRSVTKDVGTLGKVSARAGAGMRTLGRNATIAGAAVAVGLGAAVKSGLESLAERENVISATNAAIKATGGAAKVSAPEVRKWSEELETATGAAVDDKAIQAGANALLRFTNVTGANFKRTLTAATDLGAAMKTGPEQAARLLGKALTDPIKGMTQLRRAGVVLTAAEEKRIKALVKANRLNEAQASILAAVEKRYKGAAAGSAGPYTRALNLLSDAAEDAKMALAEGFLPVIERAANFLQTKLADPQTIADIRGLGQTLASGFDKAIDFAQDIPWGSIKDSMRIAGEGAKAIWSAFSSLPPWVQTAVVTGWGLNKLTGGALGGIVGELGKGLIKGVMNAGVVNINAGVVNGGGGPGGVLAGGKGGGKFGMLKGIGGGLLLGAGVGLATAAVASVAEGQSEGTRNMASGIRSSVEANLARKSLPELNAALAATEQGIRDIEGAALGLGGMLHGDAVNELKAQAEALRAERARRADAASAGVRASERSERSLDPAVARELAAVGKFNASNAPSMKSMEAHLASLKSLQHSKTAKDDTNARAIAGAISTLAAKLALLGRPQITVNVPVRNISTSTVIYNRTSNRGGGRVSID